MKITRKPLSQLLLAAALVASTATMAQQAPTIVQTQDTVYSASITGNTITIKGDFVVYSAGDCEVALNNVALRVTSCTSSQMVAQLQTMPPVGTYELWTYDDYGDGYTEVTVSPKIVEGWVNSNGTVGSGSGFMVKRNSVGNYTVSWSPNTFFAGSGSIAPPVLVRSTYGNSLGNIWYIWYAGDGSGNFTVDFGGVDTYFNFNLTQTY
jgi:hypothetical protein